MEFLLYPIVFYGLLIAFKYFLVTKQLLGIRIRYPHYEIAQDEQVPAYLRALFQTAITQLTPFNFEPVAYLEVTPTLKLGHSKAWELLMFNAALKTYAVVNIRRPLEPIALFDIELLTVLPDQTMLYTMNGKAESVLGEIPKVILQDPYGEHFSIQLEVHESRLKQLYEIQTIPDFSVSDFVQYLENQGQEYITSQLEKKHLRKSTNPEEFVLDLKFILGFLRNLDRHQKKSARLLRQLQAQAKTNPNLAIDIPVELEVDSFYRHEQLQRGASSSRNTKLGILLGSFVLFLLASAQVFPIEQLTIFVVALTLHEGGHLLAMKLFGYQDTSVFFVPFLGALATARKTDATLTQKFWVSLAGPLPGLIIGIAIILAVQSNSYPDWVSDAGWIFVSLNLFNLLPVYPLDGGQIADLLIFSRSPYLGVIFKSIGVLLLLLLGLAKPMMLMFAVLIALTIPLTFRSDRMSAKISKELVSSPVQDQDTLLAMIFQRMKQMGYGKLPSHQRYGLARTLIDRQKEVQSKWTTRLFLSFLYLFSLVGGITGALFAALPGLPTMLPYLLDSSKRATELKAGYQKEVEQATQLLQANPKNVTAYQNRARAYLKLREQQKALSDYNQLIRLSPKNPNFLIDRASIYRGMQNYQNAIQDYDRALKLQPNLLRVYRLRANTKLRLEDYRGAIKDFDRLVKSGDQAAYLQRGEAYLKLGNHKAALADANRAISTDSSDAYDLRSRVKKAMGDEQGAQLDRQKAEELYKLEEEAEQDYP